jgi:tripartite-type tricarboxylate transporter receptor subunit TctC
MRFAANSRLFTRLTCVVACALSTFTFTEVFAQGYPSRPIRLIVPYAPGGGTDYFARTVANELGTQLGQAIAVENRPGAATIIGADAAAKAPPDGYTVLVADSTTIAVNPSLYKKLPYSPTRDFLPVTLTARFAMVLVVSPLRSNASNLREFLAESKAKPGELSYASVGSGTTHHLTMELLQQRSGVTLNHVPYKGTGPAIQDLVGGQVSAMFVDLAGGAAMIKANKIKALGVASAQRSAALPNVPTLAEQGLQDFDAWAWQGLVVPAGTASDVVRKLSEAYARAIADPSIRRKLLAAGIEPVSSSPDEMARYVSSETRKWAQVIKDAGVTVD